MNEKPSGDMPPKRPRSRAKKVLIWIGSVIGVLALVAVVGFGIFKHSVDTYVDPWEAKVADAGYAHRTAQVGEVVFSYVEGPDNGEPLVLLHAQLMDWFSYSRVMPALAEDYHVYVVDYQGHGETTYPDDYPMTADRIGADLGEFLEQVVGEPAFVSGNSSGGLLTVWLAANRPDLVTAILLEDPPLFASEYPRILQTVAARAFVSSYRATEEGDVDDFLLYWLDENSGFFDRYVFPGSSGVIAYFVTSYRDANPDRYTELSFISDDTVRLLFRGLEQYDPRFGAAFYDGTWNEGFDHAEAIAAIDVPVLLMQANYSYLEDGTLDGAMSEEDADQVMSLLADGDYVRVDSGHVVHLEEPEQFVAIMNEFFLGE